jgi:hypothetical protein
MKIVTKLSTGEVAVTNILNGSTFDDCFAKWPEDLKCLYVSHREMPDEAIPTDRTFRAAWTDTTPEPVIDIDLAKAGEIHLSKIRLRRNALLDASDKHLSRSVESGNEESAASIREYKQYLRDIPQTIQPQLEVARSIEDIIAIWPL